MVNIKDYDNNNQETQDVLASILTDITMLRTWADTLRTKLNADEGVTDTNYAAPSALTTTNT